MPFTFDKSRRLYFKDGRPVKPETLRSWVSDVMQGTRARMRTVTEDFTSGAINRAQWTLEMRGLIVKGHGAVAMLAQGGREAMDGKTWGRAGAKIKSEADFLRQFERAVANEKAGTAEQIVARAELYANALYPTYQAAVVAREKAAGVSRVLRVLGEPKTDHCSDCPDLAGEYNIDEVPGIGESECGPACSCEIVSLEAAA